MFENWNDLIVTKIGLAIYVAPQTGSTIHNNRPLHGVVLNGKDKKADYVFSDGFVLKTQGNSLFYLPKGSSYKVIDKNKNYREGCWAINFDMLEQPPSQPFSVDLQHPEPVLECFKKSVTAFCKANGHSNLTIMKNLYDILLLFKKECHKQYTPSQKLLILKPALDLINSNFTHDNLSIEYLSSVCGISIAYFRRLFTEKFGIGPKEYIINRRIELAKKLLLSEQFSVGEVAEMCGYSEPCHFSREFSKKTGVSPNKYQKQYTNNGGMI